MRKWIAMLLAVASPALAQAPGGFAMQAPIVPAGQGALQRFALPFEAYRDARRDFADVRVLDGNGEPVPIAFAGIAALRPELQPALALPIFPVSRLDAPTTGRAEVRVRMQDGTLVEVRGARGQATSARPAAYILDASRIEEPIQGLAFDWEAKPGTQVVKVRVEGSDDLKRWSFLGVGPIVRLENAGQVLSQPSVEFAARKARYLRVMGDAPGFLLAGVRAERAPRTAAPTRHTRVVAATPGEKPGEWRYDLGASLPVEAVRLVPAQSNDVAAASLLARDDEKQPWRQVAWAPFYRIQVEGVEKQSPPLEIGKLPARYWLARLAAGASTPPTLEATWRGVQMVFVARGEGPFTLVFGDPKASSVALPVASIIPEYKRQAELALPEAKVGAVAAAPAPTQWERLTADVQPRRVALWAILLIGVAVLGFMAWRLLRQAKQ
jgi:uncharacterized protein DUF3999